MDEITERKEEVEAENMALRTQLDIVNEKWARAVDSERGAGERLQEMERENVEMGR